MDRKQRSSVCFSPVLCPSKAPEVARLAHATADASISLTSGGKDRRATPTAALEARAPEAHNRVAMTSKEASMAVA